MPAWVPDLEEPDATEGPEHSLRPLTPAADKEKAPDAAELALRAELGSLSVKQVKKRARSLGVDQDTIDDLDDHGELADIKAAAIELVVAVSAPAEEPAAEPAAGPRPYASVGYRDRAGGFLRGLRELAAPPAAAAAADGLAPLAALQARRPRSRHSAARPCLRSGPALLDTK